MAAGLPHLSMPRLKLVCAFFDVPHVVFGNLVDSSLATLTVTSLNHVTDVLSPAFDASTLFYEVNVTSLTYKVDASASGEVATNGSAWKSEVDRLGNDAADEAADFGRRRVGNLVIDARRNLSGVCGRWYPVLLDLHRFSIAVSLWSIMMVGMVLLLIPWYGLLVLIPKGVVWFMQFGIGLSCLGRLVFGIRNGLIFLHLLSALRTLFNGPIILGS